ncbi:hypothetical protein [Nostoc piscinale]|nr:hypothetical protein [Nostoc piscinale]
MPIFSHFFALQMQFHNSAFFMIVAIAVMDESQAIYSGSYL